MDIWQIFDITHRYHTFMNPTTSAKLDEMIAMLELAPGARVLDIACGKAEPLLRIAERYEIKATGVDISPYCIKAARASAATRLGTTKSKVEFVEMDGAAYQPEPESMDLSICLGATWVYQGLAGTLASLKKFTKPGGQILVGEIHWRQDPPVKYLQMAGLTRESCSTYSGNIDIAMEQGLIPLYAIMSTKEDFDHYEWLQVIAGERYIMEHPNEPELDKLEKHVRDGRESYLKYGRDTLGWAMYLFGKPL